VEDGSLFLERSNELLEQIILESPCDYFFFQNRYK
jgi:lauroyl/myristoyl acyltransferase